LVNTLHDDADLQNHHARWYDYTIGTWISRDPLGFDAGDQWLIAAPGPR